MPRESSSQDLSAQIPRSHYLLPFFTFLILGYAAAYLLVLPSGHFNFFERVASFLAGIIWISVFYGGIVAVIIYTITYFVLSIKYKRKPWVAGVISFIPYIFCLSFLIWSAFKLRI